MSRQKNDEHATQTPTSAPSPAVSTPATSAPATGQHSGGRICSRLMRPLPTIMVLAVLGGVGTWGHHTGWKIDKFSQLTAAEEAVPDDWCAAHSVPASICVACKAELMPKGQLYGWCRKHGVAECPLEHPDLAQLPQQPTISQDDLDRALRALNTKQRPANDPLCKLHLRRLQFTSSEAADKAGIDIALVSRAPVVESVFANGQVRYDPTRLARLSSRAAGVVWRVEVNVGQRVQKGDVLALIEAAQVGEAKSQLLLAVAQFDLRVKTHERLAGLEGVIPGGKLQEAETALALAEVGVGKAIQDLVNLGLPIASGDVRGKTAEELTVRLHFLGLPEGITAELDPQEVTANLIPLVTPRDFVTPRDGVVVTRDVVVGEVIDTTKTLFTVVDTSRMWLTLDVPVEDATYVATGQKVFFRPDGDQQEREAQVTWISTQVDTDTRTVSVRAELANDDGKLRSGSFGAGRIVIREETDAIVVPKDAIHWEGCCHVAFVRDRDYLKDGWYRVFHTRMVRPGVTTGGMTEVIAGLLPGEVVVTDGSAVLRAELLKGNLGAG